MKIGFAREWWRWMRMVGTQLTYWQDRCFLIIGGRPEKRITTKEFAFTKENIYPHLPLYSFEMVCVGVNYIK